MTGNILFYRKIEIENEESARELRAAVERGEYLLDRINFGA
jgi:hypothetical protein